LKQFKKLTILFSGVSHLLYGIISLTAPFYKTEFIRYGFEDYRLLIGGAQIVFGISLIVGLKSYNFKLLSSFGLALLMAGALATRIYIGDGFLESVPAFVYLAVNLYIFTNTLKNKK
tara:strand:+ start:365 stop:715 length:351 start_codon:yes stop_codon:yes gene_type:complete